MNEEHFDFREDPANPGWMLWNLRDSTRYNAFLGSLSVKPVDKRRALVRMLPERKHSNLRDATHGGAMLGFIDCAIFAAARGIGIQSAGGAMTIDLSAQFVGASAVDKPIVADVEILRETGRMIFVRGTVSQDEEIVTSFSATMRKPSPPRT